MDLARYKHIDLGTAATILARGTQGSAKAFKELGITLDTHIPKQQAINKAMDQLQQKIGGQAQAYLGTLAGKLAVLKSQFSLLKNLAQFSYLFLKKLLVLSANTQKLFLELQGQSLPLWLFTKHGHLATKAVAGLGNT
jgi:hypothetical protein